jgi:hypothetical protein
VPARKLLCLIARRSSNGLATMPDVHEACGLDVDAMYSLLEILRDAGFVSIEGDYPFEQMTLAGEILATVLKECETAKVSIEDVLVDLRFDLLV